MKVCVDAAVNTVPTGSFDQMSPCKSSKNTHKQTVPVVKGNMKTRSMARNDSSNEIENIRSMDTPSPASGPAMCISPETVHDSFSESDSITVPKHEDLCSHSFQYESDNDSDAKSNTPLEGLNQDFKDLESKMDNVFNKFLKDFAKACK